MLTFDQLETLRTIVRCGTFSRAADEMFLTQPAVSQRIKHLEQALGAEVFIRGNSHRGFHLTEEGERVLRFANEVLGSLDVLQHDLQLRSKQQREIVRVASGPFIARYVLPKLMGACREHYADLHVRNVQCGVDELNEVVRRGDVDFSVNTEAFVDPSLKAVPMFRDKVVLVANVEHPFLREGPASPEVIRRYQFVLSPSNTEPRQIAERWAEQLGVTLDVMIETSSYDALKEAALQGLGLAVVPETIVHQEVNEGRLCAVTMAGLPCERTICLVYNPEREMNPAASALLSVVQDGRWLSYMPPHNPC
jgi:LysR family transcriptional regulator, nitrogen assimilation regulatory protein